MKNTRIILGISLILFPLILGSCARNSNNSKDSSSIESSEIEKIMKSISIDGTMTKTEYYDDEVWDPTGLYVVARYSDETTSILDANQYNFEFSPNVPNLNINTVEVTAHLLEGTKMVSNAKKVDVKVSKRPVENKITNIKIEGELGTTVYYAGDTEWDLGNIGVRAYFKDGSNQILNSAKYALSTNPEHVNFTKSVTVTAIYNEDNKITDSKSYSVTVTGEDPEEQLKIAVFADVQLCTTNNGNTTNAAIALKQHFEYCKANDVDVIFMNGDIVNNAIESYYTFYEQIFTNVYGSDESKYPEIIWNMGNHEWWDGNEHEDANSVTMFKQHAHIETDALVKKSNVKYYLNNNETLPTYYKVVDGVPFLVISGENSNGLIGDEMKNEIANWLVDISKLDWVKKGGAIYVAYHYALNNSMTLGQGSVPSSEVINDLFKNYPQAIVYTGDTHYSGINERAINQDVFTTINIGTSSYSRSVSQSVNMKSGETFYNLNVKNSGAKSDIVNGNASWKLEYTPTIHNVSARINGDTYENRYFTTKNPLEPTKLNQEWRIKHSADTSKFTYTNDRFTNINSSKDLYGKLGLDWATDANATYDVKDGQMSVFFPDVNDYHYCESYEISVKGSKETKNYKVVSTYAIYASEKQNNYYVLENLPEGNEYEVTVKAYDFYDHPSIQTLKATKVNNKAIDKQDIASTNTYSDISRRINVEDVANANSHSSVEFYAQTQNEYKWGAILNRVYFNGNDSSTASMNDTLSYTKEDNGHEPILTCKVKDLDEADITLGITVIVWDGNQQKYLTDFGVEQQVRVAKANGWKEITWNLSELFATQYKIQDIDCLYGVYLKAKSHGYQPEGYEMNFLLDDIDIIAGNEIDEHRGGKTNPGEELTINMANVETISGVVNIDILFLNDGYYHLMISNNWTNWFGYFDLRSTTSTGDYNGLTVSSLDDGYKRFSFKLGEITNVSNGTPSGANFIFINRDTTAQGYIDISTETVDRGREFVNGKAEDNTINLKDPAITSMSTINIDIKYKSEGKFHVMFSDNWTSYFGYYDLTKSTTTGAFNGLTVSTTSDGYIRYSFKMNQLTKFVGSAPNGASFIFISGNDSTASGLIDVSVETSNVRGSQFSAGTNQTFDMKQNVAVSSGVINVDILFSGDTGRVGIILSNNWSSWFGYYYLSKDTTSSTYQGISVQTLEDGYIRFTFTLAQLNVVNGTAPSEVNFLYIHGNNTTISGYLDWSIA